MKISIITPTFNSEKYVRETIDSIHNQAYKNIEHIVVDGLSSDKTLEIVKSYNQIKWISEKDSGQSDAINKGLKLATGDILAWQNADDVYCENTFQIVADFFLKHQEVDVVYGYYQLIDPNSKWICDVFPMDWNTWMYAHGRFVPLQPTVFWRRRVTDKVGLLNEALHYCMDVDFFAKAVNNNFVFKRIPEVLGQFRVHAESKTQNSANEVQAKREFKKVLAGNFNYNMLDSFFFELLYFRSRVARRAKMKWLRK